MRPRFISALAAAVLPVLAVGIVSTQSATAAPAGPAGGIAHASPGTVRRACAAAPAAHRDECLALVRTAPDGKPLNTRSVSGPSQGIGTGIGLGPGQLQAAYQLARAAAVRGAGQTVALVDAYDDPNAAADLAAYRAAYGLPPCTTASGCFRKVNQDGSASPLPAPDAGWALEESLDIEMVSAACPRCHILLVEANDNTDTDLAAAVATAAKLGATEISNSYGEHEYAGERQLEPFYDQPGVAVTAAAGDSGYGVSYPAASGYVTSVGGTSLWPDKSTSRGWAEQAWASTGSGCSTQIPKPGWQHDAACSHRTDNDVAAVADPQTPVAVYDTYQLPGWLEAGGTSAASPIIAAAYALIGNAGRSPGGSYFYTHRGHLFDITTEANGSCYPAYLCTAGPGYDGPTGWGTPDLTGTSSTGGSCVNGWSATPPQQTPSLNDVLLTHATSPANTGIDALSPRDVWTVGSYRAVVNPGPLGPTQEIMSNIEHWDGTRWRQMPSPDPATSLDGLSATLQGVSFDRPSDGWAVGRTQVGNGSSSIPMVVHWNGSRWSLSPVLDPVSTYATGTGQTAVTSALPQAVAAISPADVWLAGTLQANATFAGAFIERWNGATWSRASLPDSGIVSLYGMHALSATDIWAVGNGFDKSTGAPTGPVAMHWDGRAWSLVKMPKTNPATLLYSVSGSSADDVWAAGQVRNSAGFFVPFTEHWDGKAWAIVHPELPRIYPTNLASPFSGVVAISPSDAWAVGSYVGFRGPQFEGRLYLVEHWDGRLWTIVNTPQTSVPDGLEAISAASSSAMWISGSAQISLANPAGGFSSYPFILHSGCRNG